MEYSHSLDYEHISDRIKKVLFDLYKGIPVLDSDAFEEMYQSFGDSEEQLDYIDGQLAGIVHDMRIREDLFSYLIDLAREVSDESEEQFIDTLYFSTICASEGPCEALMKDIKGIIEDGGADAEHLCRGLLSEFLRRYAGISVTPLDPIFRVQNWTLDTLLSCFPST